MARRRSSDAPQVGEAATEEFGAESEARLEETAAKIQSELERELASITAARAARALAASAIAELARRYAPRSTPGRQRRLRGAKGADAPTVDELCAALIVDDSRERHRVLSRFRAFGMTGEEMFDTLIPAAARRLGELWVDDAVSFADVTLGVARLEESARSIEPTEPGDAPEQPTERPSILLGVPAAEDHTLGAFIAADRFRKAGFLVQLLIGAEDDDLLRAAESRPHAMIGLSIGSRRLLDPVSETIARLRDSVPKEIPVYLGGPIAKIEPQAAEITNADGLASDVRSAIRHLEMVIAPVSYR